MLEFFEFINPFFTLVLSFIFVVIIIIGTISFKKSKDIMMLTVILISFGLMYDTLITSMGYVLEHLPYFEVIGRFRHVFHGLLTPLILVQFYLVLKNSKVIKSNKWIYLYSLSVFSFIVLGFLATTLSPMNLIDYGGVLRHSIDKEASSAWIVFVLKSLSFGTIFPLLGAGVISLVKEKDSNFLKGSINMLIFTLIGVIIDPKLTFITSFVGEVLLMYYALKYALEHTRK